MIANKHITKIVAVITALAVLVCLTAMVFAEDIAAAFGGEGVAMEYESALFDTSEIMSVNIIMDETEWQNMLDDAMSEVYYQCDVEINGKMFYRVGIRPKGNTSLSTIANDPTTNRYSFKLEFDQFVSGQTCFGLDKLILNNNYADTTNMKEALIYDMYAYIGADASLYNYAKISVNGEYWGVYLALEAVEDSFLLRNYGVQSGELYKPESMNMGGGGMGGDRGNMDFGNMNPEDMPGGNMNFGDRGNRGEMSGTSSGFTQFGSTNEDSSSEGTRPSMGNMPNGGAMPDMSEPPEDFDASQFEGEMPDMGEISDIGEMFGGGGGFSMGGGGANLNYTDDSLDSYSTIWEGEVGGTSDADHKRVVTALKNISEGTSLETYMDIENLLKYMAVHIFSVNDDSLSGSMAHNYYLYEEGGQLNIIPWDYNLAFGGMGMGGGGFGGSSDEATNTVNEAIDDAFSGTKFFDTLMANEEYHAQYYAVMQKLVEYLLGDEFENFYNRTRAQIDALVETDPNAFYTYEEYLTAVETFYELVKLRGQSIDGQLNGTIPSTATEQRNSDALIDASHLDLDTLGSMSMGGGGFSGGGDFDFSNFGGRGEGNNDSDGDGEITGTSANTTQPSGDIPEGFDPSGMGGELPEGFDPSQFGGEMPEGFDPSQAGGEIPEGFGSTQGGTIGNTETPDGGDATQGGDTAAGNEATPDGDFSFDRNDMPDMGNMPGFSGTGNSAQNTTSNLVMLGICAVLLICALLFAKFYRRTPRRR